LELVAWRLAEANKARLKGRARNAYAQFIGRFLPNSGTVTDAEEPPKAKRVRVRVL
jgi:hypothetical protein